MRSGARSRSLPLPSLRRLVPYSMGTCRPSTPRAGSRASHTFCLRACSGSSPCSSARSGADSRSSAQSSRSWCGACCARSTTPCRSTPSSAWTWVGRRSVQDERIERFHQEFRIFRIVYDVEQLTWPCSHHHRHNGAKKLGWS
jgi:hypothetical protein